MNFRATSFSIESRAIRFSSLHNSNILKYQEQISSGLRLQKPSDDPIAFRQVTSLRSRLSELTSDKQSLNSANSILNNSVVQLQEYSNIISRARVLTLQGIQSIDDGERIAIATEMDGLLSQLQDISISRFDGQFMFGGTRSTAAPFAFAEPDDVGNTLIVDYHGSNENSTAFVGQAVAVDTYYAGNELFSSPNRSDTIIYGGTGVRTGTGTDTMIEGTHFRLDWSPPQLLAEHLTRRLETTFQLRFTATQPHDDEHDRAESINRDRFSNESWWRRR